MPIVRPHYRIYLGDTDDEGIEKAIQFIKNLYNFSNVGWFIIEQQDSDVMVHPRNPHSAWNTIESAE